MLVLFDIDGTLLSSAPAGSRAVAHAWREMFGGEPRGDGVRLAGHLDPRIWEELCRVNGVPDPKTHEPRFRDLYGRSLARHLGKPGVARLLPGVAQVIDGLEAEGRATLGILTGNYPETGRLKIEQVGLDPNRFPVSVWGDEGHERVDLPPIAMTRYARLRGRSIAPSEVVVIGDTPRDVGCALANGCRALAVATGHYEMEELRAAGAHHVVATLASAEAIVRWILS